LAKTLNQINLVFKTGQYHQHVYTAYNYFYVINPKYKIENELDAYSNGEIFIKFGCSIDNKLTERKNEKLNRNTRRSNRSSNINTLNQGSDNDDPFTEKGSDIQDANMVETESRRSRGGDRNKGIESDRNNIRQGISERKRFDTTELDGSSEEGEILFRKRTKPEPKKTGIGYKVFFQKDGKLYPPMVASML